METLTTHPSNAQQATAFTSPASLSFPGGAVAMTIPGQQEGNGVDPGASGGAPITPFSLPDTAGQGVSGIVPTLHLRLKDVRSRNIVATVNLDCRLDLKTIALHARNAGIREPKTTALIFASGKMVVTGAKSEDDSRLASRKYARIIQKLGFNARFTDFKIQNIVGSCDIKFPIRLEGLASRHHHFSSYEPELFPGLIYRMIKPKIVLLIFVSGKIVLTGAKVREEIYTAFEMIYPVLNDFRKV
ncbi:hypothetical protein HO133_001380 [Letharia lupina]|uniref:TATA-box-binding protein n=1 Tax=Letharia lupina TaxID=560253 RepID=A0A8H6CFL4_9LECA|nr:uncharacterized protein HO133_001380 [Letharia lupina]KAF6222294.1 hypothetical protein HO133_001380 [Letharia lupina]